MTTSADALRSRERQLQDATAGDASVLQERHDHLRRLHACQDLHRLTRARLDLTTTTDAALCELLAAADLPVDLQWQAYQILSGSSAGANLFDLSTLLHDLTAHRRELRRQVDDLTSRVVEQLRRSPTACLPAPGKPVDTRR